MTEDEAAEEATGKARGLVADALRRATERDDRENPWRGASVTEGPFGDTLRVHRPDGSVWFEVLVCV